VHTVTHCWKCFDRHFTGEEKTVNNDEHGYNVDPTWHLDIGATDHITDELDKLTMREKYTGGENRSMQPMVEVCVLTMLAILHFTLHIVFYP
jgi:hypothetical protein